MRIDRIKLADFRNYAAQEVYFDPVCNVICGENAQGKTNLLEAMVCLSTGKSHRTRSDRELIRFSQQGFQLEGGIYARNRAFTSRIEVGYGRKKRITVNEVPAKAASDLSARSFASQGQTRTAALSLKLAAREIHREIIGEYPVLLLDDVLSELDPKRQEYVLNRIGDGQVFITCCEEEKLEGLEGGKAFHIHDGRLGLV